jgi:hypothetical protein
VVTVTHQGTDIPPVDPHRAEIALPADGIQWVEGEGDTAQLAATFNHHIPLGLVLLRPETLIQSRDIQCRRVKNGMRAHQPLVRQLVTGIGGLDQQQADRFAAFQAPHGATRQDDVVTLAKLQMAVIAKQMPAALVDEQ